MYTIKYFSCIGFFLTYALWTNQYPIAPTFDRTEYVFLNIEGSANRWTHNYALT